MSKLFQDLGEDRGKTFPMRYSEEEMKFLHEQAKDLGVHVSVLIRRALRITLVEHPTLMKGKAA